MLALLRRLAGESRDRGRSDTYTQPVGRGRRRPENWRPGDTGRIVAPTPQRSPPMTFRYRSFSLAPVALILGAALCGALAALARPRRRIALAARSRLPPRRPARCSGWRGGTRRRDWECWSSTGPGSGACAATGACSTRCAGTTSARCWSTRAAARPSCSCPEEGSRCARRRGRAAWGSSTSAPSSRCSPTTPTRPSTCQDAPLVALVAVLLCHHQRGDRASRAR